MIDETLRWETSVTMVNRETTCPVEMAGTELPAGVSVVCATGSANRDETATPMRTCGTWTVTRSPTSPSAPVATSAWACTWPGSSCESASTRCIDRLPGLRLDPEAEPVAHRRPGVPLAAAPAGVLRRRLSTSGVSDGRKLTPPGARARSAHHTSGSCSGSRPKATARSGSERSR